MLSVLADFMHAQPAWKFWLGASVVGLIMVGLAYFGFAALYRSRLIADMPTSRLRSAAQGYIELEGRARKMPGEPVYAPLSGMPCVWYSYSVEQRGRGSESSGDWGTLESGVSEAIFHLEDDTGVCVVDPDGAEITPSVRLCWRGDAPRPLYTPRKTGLWARVFSTGAYRYTECRLQDRDPLYAIGHFSGLGSGEHVGVKEATRDLLANWKRDRSGLLRRFDGDKNGEIDLDEWELARQAAEREVIATWRERQEHPEYNLLRKPGDGRPYILSAVTQGRLILGYQRRALECILGLFFLGLFLGLAINQRFG